MFGKILIANRGEIAVRIARTARAMGIATATLYSDADRLALHVRAADEAFHIGPAPARDSYLKGDAIISIARSCGAGAIHPGYGFLSENADFAEAVTRAGLIFIGPPSAAIRAMGLKDRARRLMSEAGIPVVPGYDGDHQDTDYLRTEAARIGYPILIKPIAGGGGKGMHRVDSPDDFAEELASARREATASFGDDRVLLEKFLTKARHIEFQIFADSQGNTVHLFERDCSLQRRHQKVIEEAPAPGMTAELRAVMGQTAVAAAKAVGYVGAGTVEFIADASEGLGARRFYFIEMNTRLQVEHPVTEMITGLDLVEWQLRIANGEPLPLRQNDLTVTGHAIEARLYAEDPARNFQPQAGRIAHLEWPGGVRIDTGVAQGDIVTAHYDPLIAKLIAHGPDRTTALHKLSSALLTARIGGCRTNLGFLNRLLRDPSVDLGEADTGFIERNASRLAQAGEPPIEVLAAALLHASGDLSEPAGLSPFDTLTNFRLWYGETRMFRLDVEGAPIEAGLTAVGNAEFEVIRPGMILRFTLLDHGHSALRLVVDGRIVPLTFFHHGRVLQVVHSGEIYEFAGAGEQTDNGEDETGGGLVIAAMPGTISLVRVKPGDHVAKGDAIAVTEAMKMEFTLKAPRAGKVAVIHVAAGDQVEEGAVIATIEDSDA